MKLAIFDFDKTLLQVDTLPFLLSRWKRFKFSGIKYYKVFFSIVLLYVKYKTGITSMSRMEMKVKAVEHFNQIFKGMSEEKIRAYFEWCAVETRELYNFAVLRELDEAKTKGYHTILISGAHELLLQPVGKFLEFDTIVGSPIAFKEGIYDLHQEHQILTGDQKLSKIKDLFADKKINWKKSSMYTDGYADLTLLEAVGNPVVVNPDKQLKKVARERNWRFLKCGPKKIK